jgi:FAD/FMN-containing dehydrogenase
MISSALIDKALLAELSARFSGVLLVPGEVGYDEARRVHNGLIDRHPAIIARCRGTADVVDAVNLARNHGLEIAVRGGGHNVAGKAVCTGGLMIDLSLAKGIYVDPRRRVARAQAGVTWREFNRETQVHGLATTGGLISSTGIAGLTLGGGFGWLMAKHGLAIDNLLSAEVVTASGEVVCVSENENADLFWGLRGGGGNFGVVSWLEYGLHSVGPVTCGLVAHDIQYAGEVLRFYREVTQSLPDELTLFAALLHAPDPSGTPLVGMIACYCGSALDAEAALRPIKKFGSPVIDQIAPMSYEAANMMQDPGFPRGALNYWKSHFLADLSDAAIDTLTACFANCPSPMSAFLIEHFHGAATRVGVSETAFPHRALGYNLLQIAQWLDRAQTSQNIAWAQESYDALRPYFASSRYVNYLGEDESGEPLQAAYGPNYPRLRILKTKYDPANLFHLNQNIRPE